VMALSVWLPNTAVILLGLGLLGVSMGYITPAMTTGVLTSSPAETSGIASGILNAARQVGASIGVALMGTLVQIHHESGMIFSFVLVVILSATLVAVARRVIPAS
jgi:DHA2 family methylenomycin A resistance protein-like MFS transporter